MKTIKGYLIDPTDKTIKEVKYNGDFNKIYDFIGNDCRCFSCYTHHSNGDTIYYDDEGLFHENIGAIIYDKWDTPITGRTVVFGTDEEGDTVDVLSTVEDLKEGLEFIDKDDERLVRWFMLHS